MKLGNFSAWLFVRWGIVVVVYGLTVAIGLDQIRDRDAKIGSMRETMESVAKSELESQKTFKQMAASLEKMHERNSEYLSKAKAIEEQMPSPELQKAIKDGNAMLEKYQTR